MGMRVSINIGQCPMGPGQPSTGQFIGTGPTPLHALRVAVQSAMAYYAGRPAHATRWAAAQAMEVALADTLYEPPFAGEDHYNCALTLRERKRGL